MPAIPLLALWKRTVWSNHPREGCVLLHKVLCLQGGLIAGSLRYSSHADLEVRIALSAALKLLREKKVKVSGRWIQFGEASCSVVRWLKSSFGHLEAAPLLLRSHIFAGYIVNVSGSEILISSSDSPLS